MLNRSTLGPGAAVLMLVLALALLAIVERGANGGPGDEGAPSGSNSPGDFDYYTLVMSWSPTHCASEDGEDDREQCARRDGRRYAFVLHGLWPQHERGYPLNCPTRRKPYVPEPVIEAMGDIMPGRGLVIHEYRAHGTCSGLDPAGYYALSRRLFEKIAIPDRFVNPFETQFVGPDELVDELVEANPGLEPEMIAVTCGGPGNRLRDVRVCFTKEGEFRACGENETEGRVCRAQKMHVPPVRSTRTGALAP
jgi:ribonuclease T2